MRTCACVLETYVRTDSTIYIYTARLIIEHPREWLASLADYIYSILHILTRIMVTIKKRAGVIPYSFSSSIALLSSLLSCSFYLLDLRTISSVDILEMT